jgi:hypothetical protein
MVCNFVVLCLHQTALVDESEMIKTQVGTHSKSESARTAWDALYDTTP